MYIAHLAVMGGVHCAHAILRALDAVVLGALTHAMQLIDNDENRVRIHGFFV